MHNCFWANIYTRIGVGFFCLTVERFNLVIIGFWAKYEVYLEAGRLKFFNVSIVYVLENVWRKCSKVGNIYYYVGLLNKMIGC